MKHLKREKNKVPQPRPRRRRAFALQDEQLRVTLYSVGDAVIVTDAKGRVTLMNPVAEALTGWSETDALGKPLAQVFHIINEETRIEVENPVARVLREGVVIGLANHTMLIARDGREIPIADSGAPVRDAHGKIAGVVLVFRDQTQERQAQRILRDARDFAESIVATVREPLVVLDANLRVISANRAFYRTFHVTPAETDSRLIYELGNRQWEIPQLRALLENILPQNSHFDDFVVEHEFERIGKRTMVLNARRICHHPSQTQMILLAIEDITDRQHTEDALRESEKRYRTLYESAPFVIYELSPDGTVVSLNRAFEELAGWSVDEWLGHSFVKLIHPDDRAFAVREFGRALKGETSAFSEMRILAKSGETLTLEVLGVAQQRNGPVVGVSGFARDITARKRAEESLRESEERYRTFIQQANDYIFTLNANGQITSVNKSMCQDLGYAEEELLGKSALELVAPEKREAATQALQRIWSGESVDQFELPVQTRDGKIIFGQIRGRSIYKGDQFVETLHIARDITDRKRHEREMQALLQVSETLNRTLELQPLLQNLLQAAIHAIPAAEKGSILLADEQDHLNICALSGYHDPRVRSSRFPLTQGYAARAFREQRPLLIPNVRADPTIRYNGEIEEMRAQSAIVAPLIAQRYPIGVIALDNTSRPNAFNKDDLHLLTSIAASAAIAIDNARLFDEMRRRAAQQARLNQLGRALAATLDLKTIYRTTHTHLQELVDCPNFAISLFDPVAQTLRVDYIRTNGDEPDPSLLPPLQFDPHNARAGRSLAIASQKPVMMDDLKARVTSAMIIGNEQVPDSAVYVPMIVEGKVLGLLELQSYQSHAYSLEDANLLGTAANQIGLAIQNARLFDDLRIRLTELETLRAIASVCILADDENSLIEQITDVIGNNLYPDNVGFLLMSADGAYLLPHPSYRGIRRQDLPDRVPLNAGIAGRVAASGKPYCAGDVRLEGAHGYIEIDPATRSELCVPMIVGGRVLGVINTESHKLNALSESDEHLLSTAASQVATALERIRLLEETRNRLRELEGVQQISSALRLAHTVEEMIPIFIKHAAQVAGAVAGSIYLLEASSGDWVSYGWIDAQGNWITTPKDILRHHPGEGVTGKVGATGEIYITQDWRTDPTTAIRPSEEELLSELCGGISLPLRAQEQIVGVMHVWYADAPPVTEHIKRMLTAIADIAGNALQRARLCEETRRGLDELNVLHQISQTLLLTDLEPEAIYAAVHQAIARTMPCEALSIVLEDEALGDYHGVYLYDKSGRAPAQRVPRGTGLSGLVIPSGKPLVIDDYPAQSEIKAVHFGDPEQVRSILAVPLRRDGRTIGMVATQAYQPKAFDAGHRALLETLAAQFAAKIERARLFAETRARLRELEIVSTVSAALRAAPTHREMFSIILDQLIALLNIDGATIEMLDLTTGELLIEAACGVLESLVGERIPPGAGLSAQVLATGKPYLNNDARNDPRLFCSEAFGDCRAAAGVPLEIESHIIGLLWITSRRNLTEHDARLLTAIANIAANAIHRATLNEQTERHLRRLATLHIIDRAITSSFDLQLTLNLLLEHTLTQLQVDAASVLLLNPQTQMLEYAASRGFRTRAIEQTRLRVGESFAGRAALERQSVHIPDLASRADGFVVKGLAAEGYTEYFGVPLIAKGNVVGVMEIFHRAPIPRDQEWFNFCETLAGQAAIAVDNARLFGKLQQANTELAQAYEATIEGWSRALDLRDKETEGHTQRVTEMTLALVRALGASQDEIVHIRRGALLHDIGKMGVSDSILLKPGKLTEAEMAVMREHPQRAYELLLPIEYLQPALDIPYCHHEKWDGTGYPRGLKGEQIPLAARIFAVVDVYDALTSDRPYRPAWSKEKALEYIRAESGKHFDPRVVKAFMQMFSG